MEDRRMKMSLFSKLKNQKSEETIENKEVDNVQRVSMSIIEQAYDSEKFVDAAIMLKVLIEYYGEHKKNNHRYKGREFMFFIMSNKHKDLKNVGYSHWVNLGKLIQSKNKAVYPYHKQNLRNAIDFFKKEIKSLSNMKTIIRH